MSSLLANARWELLRLLRSRRIFLLVIPVIAGPIGSALSFLYFSHVQPNGAVLTHGTAMVLGLFVTGGLAGIVMLDLAALTVGEELSRRSHLLSFALPQSRGSILAGRLLIALGAPLAVFVVGGLAVWPIAGALVPPTPADPAPLFDAFHLFEAILALLLFLGVVAVSASVIARSASEALVAGVLAGVVTAASAGYLVYLRQITMAFPALLVLVAVAGLLWTSVRFERLES